LDLRHHLKRMEDVLAQALEHEPSIAELSARTGCERRGSRGRDRRSGSAASCILEEVSEGSEGEATQALAERIGAIDPVFEVYGTAHRRSPGVEALPPELRDILEQRYFQGATPQEVERQLGIAQISGCPPGTAGAGTLAAGVAAKTF